MQFDKEYMRKRMYIAHRAEKMASAIMAAVPKARTVIDMGCATGDTASGLLAAGLDVRGIDSSEAGGECLPEERFFVGDVTQPISKWPISFRRYDLGILMDVLSIMTKSQAAAALKNATRWSRVLLVNYLGRCNGIDLLESNKWRWDVAATEQLRDELEPLKTKQAFKATYLSGEIWRRL